MANKTQFVLGFKKGTAAADIIAAGKKQGIELTNAYIYSVRSKASKKPAAQAKTKVKAKPGRKAASNGGHLVVVAPPSRKHLDALGLDGDVRLLRLVVELGTDKVHELIDAFEAPEVEGEKAQAFYAELVRVSSDRVKLLVASIVEV